VKKTLPSLSLLHYHYDCHHRDGQQTPCPLELGSIFSVSDLCDSFLRLQLLFFLSLSTEIQSVFGGNKSCSPTRVNSEVDLLCTLYLHQANGNNLLIPSPCFSGVSPSLTVCRRTCAVVGGGKRKETADTHIHTEWRRGVFAPLPHKSHARPAVRINQLA
jgi:hypothetical protein